jgi:hypothetical protein
LEFDTRMQKIFAGKGRGKTNTAQTQYQRFDDNNKVPYLYH